MATRARHGLQAISCTYERSPCCELEQVRQLQYEVALLFCRVYDASAPEKDVVWFKVVSRVEWLH
jgi:hypothetical protein